METNTTTHATPEVSGGDAPGTTRTPIRVAAAGLAVVLIATLVLIGASPASAAPPTSHGFSPPVVQAGGTTHAYLNCAGDEGGLAIINVSKDGSPLGSYMVTVGSDEGAGYLRIVADADSSGHVVDTDNEGRYAVEVLCPSYSWTTLDLRVQPLTLGLTTWMDINDNGCTTVDDINEVKVAAGLHICYSVTNNTGKDIRFLTLKYGDWADKELTFGPGSFPTGATKVGYVGQSRWLNPEGETASDLYAWAEIDMPGSGELAGSEVQSIVVPAASPALDLKTTVALAENDACASEDGAESLTVAAGTEVWVCYEVTNTSKTYFDVQDLAGPNVGTLLDGDTTWLYEGNSRKVRLKLTITADIDVTASWTATTTSWDYSYTATDGATILLEVPAPPVDEEEPQDEPTQEPTTTTTAPTDVPADNGEVAPTDGNDPTDVEGFSVVAISAQPKYAG